MMRRLIFGFVLLLTCGSSISQQPRLLTDGAPIQLAGVLRYELRGNCAHLALKPSQSYSAVFDSGDRRIVREIGLEMDGQWDSLKALVGQNVSVAGVVQLEPNSPYYWNGTLIKAKSIHLANGSVLIPKPYKSIELPAGLARFHTLVTFAPRASQRWTYKTWDNKDHLLLGSQNYLTCALNGPGDVMNCYCPNGFLLTATGKIIEGHFSKAEDSQDEYFAQFSIADPVRHSVSKAVECTRQAHPY